MTLHHQEAHCQISSQQAVHLLFWYHTMGIEVDLWQEGMNWLEDQSDETLDEAEEKGPLKKDTPVLMMPAKKRQTLSKSLDSTDSCGPFHGTSDVKTKTSQGETRPPLQKESAPQVASSFSQKSFQRDKALSKTQQLAALRKTMEDFTECSLAFTANSMVFGEGDPDSPIMLVGEAPGAEEDAQGRPFVGLSGQLLTLMLKGIGLKRESVYISNIVPWRPPFNRQPSVQEIALCLPFIKEHISIIQPKILICVGSVSSKALLNTQESMGRLQGKSFSYPCSKEGEDLEKKEGHSEIKAFCLYHPAYLLRSPGQKKGTWQQLLYIQKHIG